MKKLLFVLAVCGAFYAESKAAISVAETPVNAVGTPVTVSISTTSWTKVPTSQTSGRFGIVIDLPSTSTGPVVGHMGNCSSTSVATTIRPFEVIKGDASSYISMREDVCLWLLSIHTVAENIHYQEMKK